MSNPDSGTNSTNQEFSRHNKDKNAWILSKRAWYWLSFIVPSAPITSAFIAVQTGNGLFLWFTVVLAYVVIPFTDRMFGLDDSNPSSATEEEIQDDRYYVHIMYLATAMHWISLVGVAYVVSQYEWSWFSILGGALSAGIVNGVGIVAGHEMGHKVNDKGQTLAAKLILACSGYGHFSIEHNKGHHRHVATPEDPASARLGESVYKFSKREIPGAFRRAWQLEAERLHRLGKSEWSWSNEIIQPAMVTIGAYVLMLAYFGPVMIPFLAIAASFGWWQLTCANYIEHYGLLRLKKESGRYERCQPWHSWNSNHKVSNLMLLHLQRHSDHHAHPTRPYQILRDYDDVPELPSGYPWMYVIAMLPKAWFAVMNPKVVDWAKGDMNLVNIDPDQKDDIFARYHNPQAA